MFYFQRKSTVSRPDAKKDNHFLNQNEPSQKNDSCADTEVVIKPESGKGEGEDYDYNLIDTISRIAFPFAFALWNIGFFLVITKRV